MTLNKLPKNKQPKIIFFDIDNTLMRVDGMPVHNRETLVALHKSGIKVIIATGRGMAMMPKAIADLVKEGVVHAYGFMNGQYSRTRDTVISHYPLTDAQIQGILTVCQSHRLIHKFDSAQYIAWSEHTPFFDAFHEKYPNFIVDPEHHKAHDVYQCSFILNQDTDLDRIKSELSHYDLGLTFWSSRGADILPLHASKLIGMRDICAHFGLDISESMAFGDGPNDVTMLAHAGVGVAMGDGWDELKSVADFITGSIEEKGIQTALTHYGVL